MRKLTKITLIIVGVLICLGIGCLVGAVAFGLNKSSFADMVFAGKFSFDSKDIDFFDRDEHHIGFENGNKNSMTISEVCKNLEIEIATGSLEIYYDDVEEIQVEQNGMHGFKSYVEERTLCIESESNIQMGSSGLVKIVIPKNMRFYEVDLELGASQTKIEELSADIVNIEVGAGEAQISKLDTFDLDVEVGMGSVELELLGTEKDCNYKVECGIGSVKFGETSYAGMGTSKVNNIDASRYIDIECGIGEVKVSFLG